MAGKTIEEKTKNVLDNPSHFARRDIQTVAIIVAAVALFYIINFSIAKIPAFSDNPEHWGQFGDYIGGILNPMVAFAAFLYLVHSFNLQSKEVVETRKALSDSAESQKQSNIQQMENIRVQISRMTIDSARANIDIINVDIDMLSRRRDRVIQRIENGASARETNGNQVATPQKYLDSLNKEINKKVKLRSALLDEMSKILKKHYDNEIIISEQTPQL